MHAHRHRADGHMTPDDLLARHEGWYPARIVEQALAEHSKTNISPRKRDRKLYDVFGFRRLGVHEEDQASPEQPTRDELLDRARHLLHDLTDSEAGTCEFDHHGYCQAHGWMDTEPGCPFPRARALLAILDR